jgi:hypothetical protein
VAFFKKRGGVGEEEGSRVQHSQNRSWYPHIQRHVAFHRPMICALQPQVILEIVIEIIIAIPWMD